jgi:hypothetical protein
MRNKFFTPEEDAYLTAQYRTTTTTTEMAQHLGRSEGAIYSRAIKLGLRRPSVGRYKEDGTATKTILAAASRPEGVSAADMKSMGKMFQNVVGMLRKRGQLFSAQRYGLTRYFTTKEAAAIAEAQIRAANPPKMWGVSIKAAPRGPAHMPGEPIRTKNTKITRAKTPVPALWTNTHARY